MGVPMQIKDGAVTAPLRGELYFAAGVAEVVYRQAEATLVITSGNDGEHKPGSLHYKNLAIDCRTRQLSTGQKMRIFTQLFTILNPMGFDVVLETLPPHIHIEFDPKLGEHFLTAVA